jgi:hypothetical protein
MCAVVVSCCQQKEPLDPYRPAVSLSDDREGDLFDRTMPWHRLFGICSKFSSFSSSSSEAGHAMGGKTIDSSTSIDALKKSSISKLLKRLLGSSNEQIDDRDRFRFFKEIIGWSLLITGFRRCAFIRSSSAAVAGERAAVLGGLIEAFMIM